VDLNSTLGLVRTTVRAGDEVIDRFEKNELAWKPILPLAKAVGCARFILKTLLTNAGKKPAHCTDISDRRLLTPAHSQRQIH
jgi:hypothetical protein